MNTALLADRGEHGLTVELLEAILEEYRGGELVTTIFSREDERVLATLRGRLEEWDVIGTGKDQIIVTRFTNRFRRNGSENWIETDELTHRFVRITEFNVLTNGKGSLPLTIYREARSHYVHGDRTEFHPPEKAKKLEQ